MLKFSKDDLVNLPKTKEHLIGIDSDGCVFDSMGIKQINHFHPIIIRTWGLETIESELRQAAEFVNLYSHWRGSNRFTALLKMFDLLSDWPVIAEKGARLPDTGSLRTYVESGLPLGNPSLTEEVERTGDQELRRCLDWSLAVNADIAAHMEEIPPFPSVKKCLEKMHAAADLVVVSQTPEEALVHEWDLHGIDGFVTVIAGQELGTKTEHLMMARGNRYPQENVMLIGDAPGDQKAAESVGACFFPILPGTEDESWINLRDEGLDRFLNGTFSGQYQYDLIRTFESLLPDVPPWKL